MLRVYAREVNIGQVTWVSPEEDNVTYTIRDLAPGTYIIVGLHVPGHGGR